MALKVLTDFETVLQSTKLRFCEVKMPIFGVKWGGADEFCGRDGRQKQTCFPPELK